MRVRTRRRGIPAEERTPLPRCHVHDHVALHDVDRVRFDDEPPFDDVNDTDDNDDSAVRSPDTTPAAGRQYDGVQTTRCRVSILDRSTESDLDELDDELDVDNDYGADGLGDRSLHRARDR
jgi:hypothetical protein